jgi:hypothetical protein
LIAETEPNTTPNLNKMSAFETAVKDSKKLTSKPSNDELLQLYGSSLLLLSFSRHIAHHKTAKC